MFAIQNVTPLMDVLQKNAAELGKVSLLRQKAATEEAGTAMTLAIALDIGFAVIVLLIAR